MEILVILLLILLNGLLRHVGDRAHIGPPLESGDAGPARQRRRPPGPETGQRPRPVPLDRTDRHHPDRHPHGYLLRRRAGGEIRPESSPDWVFPCARRRSRRRSRSSSSVTYLDAHIRRTRSQTHRHERGRAGRQNRCAADAAALGRWPRRSYGCSRSSTAGVARLLGLQRAESKVTEAEIRSIIQEGAEDGEVQAVEQQIMGRVFSLGDRTVESIMTHRSELAWIDVADVRGADPRDGGPSAPQPLPRRRGESRQTRWAWSASKTSSCTWATRDSTCAGWSLRPKFFHEGFEVYNALEQLRTRTAGLRHHLRRIRRDARHHHPAATFSKPWSANCPTRARSRTSSGARTAAVWSTGNALSTTFSTGSVWRTPCPATPTTPSAA